MPADIGDPLQESEQAQDSASILRPLVPATALASAIALEFAPMEEACALADAVAVELLPWRHCTTKQGRVQSLFLLLT